MFFNENLPDGITHRMSVPIDPHFSTHDKDYLKKVNGPNGAKNLIEAIWGDNIHWLSDSIFLSRNRAPHGLWGLILWDIAWKNFLELSTKQQIIFIKYLGEIEKKLRDFYWSAYYILLWMCLSQKPGPGKRQSIGFTHAHFSLIPKKQPPVDENGIIIDALPERKELIWWTYSVNTTLLSQLKWFWQAQLYDSSMLVTSEQANPHIEIPHYVLNNLNKTDILSILRAQDKEKVRVWSTMSVILTEKMKTRIMISIGTQGYLHVDGIELIRERVSEKRSQKFNTFGESCFTYIKGEL